MEPLSAFVTTFNNERTLAACLESVAWADEIVVLDSYSTDATLDIAARFNCRVFQHAFLGYGPQKQLAMEKTIHEWVLLLDADEALSPELQTEIRTRLGSLDGVEAFTIPRLEQQFWRMTNRRTAMNRYLRLFKKELAVIADLPVHAAPTTRGRTASLRAPFYHFGEPDIHTKVEKINAYSTGLVADKLTRGRRGNPLVMLLYPPWFFVRLYILKRNCLSGWTGFISSVVGAFYVFLKYAKVYERVQQRRHGESLMPDSAPPPPRREE